jgi:hypothetical protein
VDDFQKQLQLLKPNPVFAKAFGKRRTEAEVAFQIRRLREAKNWSQKDFGQEGRSVAASRLYPLSNKPVTNGTLCRYFVASPPFWTPMLSSLWFHAKPRRLLCKTGDCHA